MLNELPAEDAQADYTLLELLLHSLIQVTTDGVVSISLSERDGLLVSLLCLLNFLTEHISHRVHIHCIVQ